MMAWSTYSSHLELLIIFNKCCACNESAEIFTLPVMWLCLTLDALVIKPAEKIEVVTDLG